MPSREDGINRDELDAISAEELLKKLKGEIIGITEEDKEEIQSTEASRISKEAEKMAQESIVHGNPEEFADDLESLMRMVMNMPAEDSETNTSEKSNEDIKAVETAKDAKDPDESDKKEITKETEPKKTGIEKIYDDETATAEIAQTLNFNDGEPLYEESAELDTIDEAADGDMPWADNEDGLLYKQATEETEVADETKVFDTTEIESIEKTEIFDSDEKGFLAEVVKLVNEDLYGTIPETSEQEAKDEFDFVADEISEEEGKNQDTAGADDVVLDADGGREYLGIGSTEFDSTELSLLSLFGSEENLEEAYGREKVDEIIESASQALTPNVPKKKKFYEQFSSEYEYINPEQKQEIQKKYAGSFRWAGARLAFASIFAIALFFVENIRLFGIAPISILDVSIYPTVFAMIDLQLVFLCALAAYKQIAHGAVTLVKLKPSKQSITVILLAASTVYTILASVSGGLRTGTMYNFPIALALMLSIVAELMDTKRVLMGFDVVSSEKKKYVIRHISTEEREQDAEEFKEYVLEDSAMFAVTKARFVDGFFEHINKKVENSKFTGVLLIINAAEVMLASALGVLMGNDLYTVATMAFVTLALGLGATAVMASAHSFYRASKSAHDNGCAIIGEASLEEYCDGSVVFFDDKDIFPSTGVRMSSIKVYGDNRIDSVIFNAGSVFAKVGGPLKSVFELATVDVGHSDNVEMLAIENGGINGTVDSKEFYLGSNAYMIEKGFETPYNEIDVNNEKKGERIMFMADENEILAKFTVQYNIDFEYEIILKQLYKAGMCVGVRTQDPNIDREFIMMKLKLKKDYPIKVVRMKPGRDRIRTVERTNSGIVSVSNVKSLLKTLSLCDKIKYVSKIHNMLLVVSAVMALILVYVATAFGKLNFGSLYALLYQLFWFIPMTLVTLFAE